MIGDCGGFGLILPTARETHVPVHHRLLQAVAGSPSGLGASVHSGTQLTQVRRKPYPYPTAKLMAVPLQPNWLDPAAATAPDKPALAKSERSKGLSEILATAIPSPMLAAASTATDVI